MVPPPHRPAGHAAECVRQRSVRDAGLSRDGGDPDRGCRAPHHHRRVATEWPKDNKLLPGADDETELRDDDQLLTHALGPLETIGVRGAIRELEKRFPAAGFALVDEFFPRLVRVEPERYRHRRERQFWEWMFARRGLGQRPKLVFKYYFGIRSIEHDILHVASCILRTPSPKSAATVLDLPSGKNYD